jgi:ketosteroid isomerase-like protein
MSKEVKDVNAKQVDLFDRFCAVCVDKDVDRVMEIFTDDAEILESGLFLRGKKAIREFMEREAPKFSDYVIEKMRIFEKPDEIAVEWKNHYKYEGRPHDVLGVIIIKSRDGKIKRMDEYLCTSSTDSESYQAVR